MKKKKLLLRAVSILLSISLFFTATSVRIRAESSSIKAFSITFESTVAGLQNGVIYQMGDRYYLPLDDILKYTGSSKTVSGSVATLKRGSRSIRIDTAKGTLTEDDVENAIPTGMIQHEGEDLFPAYAMLAYLGASCAFKSGHLMISMPGYSLWDALDFPVLQYALTPQSLWGNNLSYFLFCDSILEFIKNMDAQAPYDKIFAESLNDVMQVEPTDYPAAVQEEAAYIIRMKKVMDLPDAKSTVAQFISNVSSNAKDQFDFTSDYFGLSEQIMDKTASASIKHRDFSSNIPKEIVDAKDFKTMADTLENASDITDVIGTVADIFATAKNRANYSASSVSALSEIVKAYPTFVPDYKNSFCYQGAQSLNDILKNKGSIFAKTAIDKSLTALAEHLASDGRSLFETRAGTGGIYLQAIKVGAEITARMPWNIEAFKNASADLHAILLVQFLLESGDCINGVSKQITQSHYKDEKLIEIYRLMYILWTKATMAANAELIKVAENGGNASIITPLTQRNQALSVFLFKLVNATASAIPDYKDLYNSTDLDKKITGLVAAPTAFSVTMQETKQMVSGHHPVDMQLSLPLIQGGSAAAQKINSYYDSIKSSFIQSANDIANNTDDTYLEFPDRSFHSYMQSTVGRNDGKIFSVKRAEDTSFGMRHSEIPILGDTFQAESGEKLAFSDLFQTDQSSALKAVMTQIMQSIPNSSGPYNPDLSVDELIKQFDTNDFYLDNSNLHVIFQMYTIGGTGLGTQDFAIPYSQIQSILKPSVYN